MTSTQSTLEGNYNLQNPASAESNPFIHDNLREASSNGSNEITRKNVPAAPAVSGSTNHLVGAYSTGGRLPLRNRGQQQEEQSTQDPYHQQQQGVVKLEHIVCYKVLPFLLIIAASLGGVEMFYREAEFSACAPDDNNCTITENDAYVVSGAFAGLFSSLVVLYQYLTRPHLRVYPNPLLVRQTIADATLACVVIALYTPHNLGTVGHFKDILKSVLGIGSSALLLYMREYQWFVTLVLFVMALIWLYNRGGSVALNDTATTSCLVPSTAMMLCVHKSLWQLPLLSIDLYRTMTNPFLDFSRAILQYDVILYAYLFAMGFTFVILVVYVPGVGSTESTQSSEADKGVYCPVLRKEDVYAYLYPIAWLYLEIVASTLTSMIMAYFAYRRLVSGTSESIITRLRIIVTNFRNILTHFVWLFGLFVLNSLTYIQTSSALWPRVLVFWLFGRGLVDLVCWFWVNGDASKKAHRRAHSSFSFNPASFLFKRSSVGADVNVNKSLQKEMTSYLGRGLRRSSQPIDFNDPEISKGWRTIPLRGPNEDPNSLRLDFWRFSRLLLGINRKDSSTASFSKPPQHTRKISSDNFTAEDSSTEDESSHMSSYGSDLGLNGNNLERSFYADPTRFFGRKPGEANDGNGNVMNDEGVDGEGAGGMHSSFASNAKRNWSEKGPFLTEYSPVTFRAVRETYGVSESSFHDAWQQDGLELKVNKGGASQAFFFFSSDKRFIVKSCTLSEMTLLRNMAMEYAEHLARYPESFLVRIYGAYNLVVYGTHFRFFVMENLFYVRPPKTSLSIYERYDIKGSWVSRNFSPPTAGQQTYCRLCGQKYVVGKKKDKCSAHVQGLHAPNVILKDCDLSSKFQIEPDQAYRISLQLERDSKFLMLRNIMDYSLLVGISYKKIPVTWRNMDSTYESSEGEWAALLSMTESERMEIATDRAEEAYRAVVGNSTTSAPFDSVDTSSSRAGGSSAMGTSSSKSQQSTGRNGSSGMCGHQGGVKVLSRAVQQINLGMEPTTQGQDCCIEASSIVGPNAYYFGMIDILQEWTWEKRLERFFKTYFLAKDPSGLSAIAPNNYQERFMQRLGDIMNLTEESLSASSQLFRSSRSHSVPLDESVVLMPPGLDQCGDDDGDDDDEEAAELLPTATSLSEHGSTNRASSTALTREELRAKQTTETQDDVSPPLNRVAARNARAASITEASRQSLDLSSSRGSVSGGSVDINSRRGSRGLGSSVASTGSRSSYNRTSAMLGLSPLREGKSDSDVQLAGTGITDI